MSRYQKKWMLKTAPDVRTIILTHTFIDSIPLLFHFQANKCNQRPLNFSINHWYQIKSRSNEISQIKLTLLLLFLLFAEHKGINSNGTIHNIMADGIFIEKSMYAEIKLWGEYINYLTITTKRTVFLILPRENEYFYMYWRISFASYTIFEENWRLLVVRQVVFYSYRILTLSNYKK